MPGQSTQPAPIRPIYVVHGKDAFLQRINLRRIIAHVVRPDPDPMTLSEHDGETAELAAVLDDVRTLSLLSDRRLVIVRSADEFVKRHRAALEKYVASPCRSGVLTLVVDSWPRTTKLAKAVDQIGMAVACDPPPAAKLPAWLTTYAQQKHGRKLDPAAARKIIDLTGAELADLCNEVDKLAIYVGPAPAILAADVDALVGQHQIGRASCRERV